MDELLERTDLAGEAVGEYSGEKEKCGQLPLPPIKY